MPCVDAPNAAHPYDIHITVAKDQTAVASGQLLKQRWTAQHRKKFYFNLPQATVASQIAFAVGKPLWSTSLLMPIKVPLPGHTPQALGSLSISGLTQ